MEFHMDKIVAIVVIWACKSNVSVTKFQSLDISA